MLNKKNGNIHPFEDPASLEFLALKNDCGLVVFGTHSKKRPNNITVVRVFDGKVLDMAELLLITESPDQEANKFDIGLEMKPMVLFAGSQWDDTSVSDQAALHRCLKSVLLDLFQGEEISSIDVEGLQYVLMVASGEPTSTNIQDPASKPVIHLRWYKIRTLRSNSPKLPRVELDPIGPTFDFRVGRHREADPTIMKEAMKHGRRPNEARTKKNINMDIMGDKIGRVHLGKQDLNTLQTRKMKGLKRGRNELEDDEMDGVAGEVDADIISEDEQGLNGGMDLDDVVSEGGSSGGGSGDEIDIDDDDHMDGEEVEDLPKRQRLA